MCLGDIFNEIRKTMALMDSQGGKDQGRKEGRGGMDPLCNSQVVSLFFSQHNAEDKASISRPGSKIPQAAGQLTRFLYLLSPQALEPVCCNWRARTQQ